MTKELAPDQITSEILLKAYAAGIFPMSESADDPGLFWVEPKWRGILPLDDFHIPKRLQRTLRHAPYRVSFNTAFEDVISHCAKRVNGDNTWINDRIKTLYIDLFKRGFCHSVECWQNDELVGGLYGVSLGAAFFGESMFSHATDASKIALVHLVAKLRAGGYQLLDTQFITKHLQQFGAVEIAQADYMVLLGAALEKQAQF